jgi:hypothetical protein
MITGRQKSSLNQRRNDAGYTVIELFEAIAAIALGGLLADKLSSHFHGFWHTTILWTVRTAGSGVIFIIFLYGFGYLFGYLGRRKTPKPAEPN